jgi:hypothetical protein
MHPYAPTKRVGVPLDLPRLALALGALSLPALAACSAPKPEPEFATSANHSHYARDYPAELGATTKGFSERRAEARKIMGEFNGYPSKLKDPPSWPHVLEVVDRADEDGRSYAYVDRLRRVQGAAAFFDAEKDEINRKVAGSVAYVAKKKSCDESIAGAAVPALKDAIDKQLELPGGKGRVRSRGFALDVLVEPERVALSYGRNDQTVDRRKRGRVFLTFYPWRWSWLNTCSSSRLPVANRRRRSLLPRRSCNGTMSNLGVV